MSSLYATLNYSKQTVMTVKGVRFRGIQKSYIFVFEAMWYQKWYQLIKENI